MIRSEVIQSLINHKKHKTYLEIGVSGGRVFFNIRCYKKIAVDPFFRFNWKGVLGEISRNITNLNNRYYEMESDDFFASKAQSVLAKRSLNVCLVDGMHEFRYALNDVLNSLKYLSANGTIIMHDCNPQSPEAECSFLDWQKRNFSGAWNGDVWKVIVFLRSFRNDLDVFVADCDEGLGIITWGRNDNPLHYKSYEEIDALNYTDLLSRRAELLNLKPVSYLQNFLLE